MSAAAIIGLVLGLLLWIIVAWWMLANQPPEALDWRDQIAFAFWPVTIPAVILIDIGRWLVRLWKARR